MGRVAATTERRITLYVGALGVPARGYEDWTSCKVLIAGSGRTRIRCEGSVRQRDRRVHRGVARRARSCAGIAAAGR